MKPIIVVFMALSMFQGGAGARRGMAQEVSPDSHPPETTFHVSSDLVLVDVIALGAKEGLPVSGLNRDDFEIFDNDRRVPIKTFDTGAATRPLALWFVVQCSMQGWQAEGSGLFAGQINLFKPALSDLGKQDTVAVAHWCDDGESQLDLMPTPEADSATTTLEHVLAATHEAPSHDRPGELALQKTLQLIIDATKKLAAEPVPVLIFLYGDYSAMPRAEANVFIDQLLATSAIAFGLKDRRSPKIGSIWLSGEQSAIANYIAMETGGQYLRVTPETYSAGLTEILRQLHSRYEIGFRPAALDGKRHTLRVRLIDAAKNEHKGVHLRYRSAYVPAHDGGS